MSKRNEYPDDLGQAPDRVIAEREGVHATAVHYWRKKLGIPRWRDNRQSVTLLLDPEHVRMLDELSGRDRHEKMTDLLNRALDAGVFGD